MVGVLNLVSALTPSLPERRKLLREFLPLVLVHGSRHLVVLAGFLLILIAQGIFHRKKAAWWMTFILVMASVFLHLFKGLDFEEAIFAALVVFVLVVLYPIFQARSDIPTIRNAFNLFGMVLGLNIIYGMVGFWLLNKNLHLDLQLTNCLRDTLAVMFSSYSAIPQTHHSRWFLTSLWIMWETGLALFLIMLLRPVIYRRGPWQHEHNLAVEIARKYGKSSLVYFTLWDDKAYFFNDTNTGYVAFCQVGDVAVALGDPVGPDNEREKTIGEFISYCTTNGWQTCFYQILPEDLRLYQKYAMSVLHIGDEAIVNLTNFDLSGRRFKNLRNNSHRFCREGFKTTWHTPPLNDKLVAQLRMVSMDWLRNQGGEEKAFSLGWFDEEELRQNEVVTVEDATGKIYAFANFVPMFCLPQSSPDMMRYSQDAPAGIMDYLFVESMLHFKDLGVEGFNLGLAPLAHVGQEVFSSVAEKAVNLLYENFYNFKGLYEFKAKFYPGWEPRYLIYPNLAVLPKVVLAIIRAGNPGGLAKFWRWGQIHLKGKNR